MYYQLGWRRDLPDYRDYNQVHPSVQPVVAKATQIALSAPKGRVPTKDLRAYCSPIEDQGQLGSCTAQAGVGLMEWFQRRAYGKHLDMSRLFLYKVARRLANIKGDEGCYLRTTMQAMIMLGIPPEKLWPYKIIDFDKEPDSFIYSVAHKFEAYSYYKLTPQPGKTQLDVLLDHLAGGLPFMFGFTVYSSISNEALIPFPKPGDYVEGGHAIVAVGYDDTKKALLIRNSWGTTWGDRGYGYLPYEYINKGLADDFWSLVRADFIDTDLFKV
jgi:C1A family cysteine protease